MARKSLIQILLISVFMTFAAEAATVSQCNVNSSAKLTSLIELYTSEGCSSCPPADKWLSQLESKGVQTDLFVPLSFHVDYWNYIGWTDPYSQSKFTQRQRAIAARGRLSTIYTPQVVLNGADYRSWRRQNTAVLLQAISENKPQATISLSLDKVTDNQLELAITTDIPSIKVRPDAQLFVAVFENNLSNAIASGENRGRVLAHDYVVRKLSRPYRIDAGNAVTKHAYKLSLDKHWKRNDLGVAAFVQNKRTGKVYQALSMSLNCNK